MFFRGIIGGSIGVINKTDFTLKIDLNNGGTNYHNSDEVLPRQMFLQEYICWMIAV